MFIVVCFIISGITQLVFPVYEGNPTNIKIIATNDKNIASQGNEVWIKQIIIDGIPVSFDDLDYDKSQWELKYDALVSYKSKPAELRWNGFAAKSIGVNFINHSYSGKAVVYLNENIDYLDLYSVSQTEKMYTTKLQYLITLKTVMALIGNIFVCFFILLTISLPVLSNKILDQEHKTKNSLWWLALPYVFVWMVYLLAFYPGLMSPDSFYQWTEAMNSKFTDLYPAFHTFLIWIIIQFWNSPAAVAAIQIIFMSLIVGYALATLYQYKVNKSIIAIVALFYLIYPIYGFMAITLWKDIPHSISMLWLSVIIIKIYMSNGEWIIKNNNLLLITLVLVLVSLLRHEGIVAAFGTVVILYIFYPQKLLIKKLFFFWISMIIVIKALFILVLNIGAPMQYGILVPPVQHIATALNQGWAPNTKDKEILERILPLDVWNEKYNRYGISPLLFDKRINLEALIQNKREIFRIWSDIVFANPKVVIGSISDFTSIIWKIKKEEDAYEYNIPLEISQSKEYKIDTKIMDNSFGIKMESMVPAIQQKLLRLYLTTTNSKYDWLFWRPALLLYITCFFVFNFCIVRGYKAVTVLSPIAFQVCTLFLVIQGQDVRYMFSVFLIAPFIIAFTFNHIKLNDKVE